MIFFPMGGRYCSRIIVLGGNAFVFERMSVKMDTAAIGERRFADELARARTVYVRLAARLAFGSLPDTLLALLILPVDLLQRHPSKYEGQDACGFAGARVDIHFASEPGRSSTERILGSMIMRVVKKGRIRRQPEMATWFAMRGKKVSMGDVIPKNAVVRLIGFDT
jgi:hypothetical protein